METKSRKVKLPTIIEKPQYCTFNGYDAISLMEETAKLRRLITKRETLEILIPICCTTDRVRYMKIRQTLRGISSGILSACHIHITMLLGSFIISLAVLKAYAYASKQTNEPC
jgi:hypothetical protein